MSLDLLKEARTLLADGVSAAEALFGRHNSAVAASNSVHANVSADLSTLKAQFGELLTKVDAVVAEFEADVAKPLADRIKALVAQL